MPAVQATPEYASLGGHEGMSDLACQATQNWNLIYGVFEKFQLEVGHCVVDSGLS